SRARWRRRMARTRSASGPSISPRRRHRANGKARSRLPSISAPILSSMSIPKNAAGSRCAPPANTARVPATRSGSRRKKAASIASMTREEQFAMRLERKTAVVTGGARGIGRAIAEGYAREGARVCIADIDDDAARATARDTGGGAFAVHLDVTRIESINRLIEEVETKAGGIDILVNNAAIFDLAPIEEITEKSYDRIFAVNVKGLLFTLQTAAKSMIRRGKGGKIINMASQAGRRGEALVAVYCASKAAVISITQSAGLGLIKHRINVNGIAPVVVDTPMWDEVDALFAKYE